MGYHFLENDFQHSGSYKLMQKKGLCRHGNAYKLYKKDSIHSIMRASSYSDNIWCMLWLTGHISSASYLYCDKGYEWQISMIILAGYAADLRR